MKYSDIRFVLTDIEGTTTSVSFVYDILFPYFRNNIEKIRFLQDDPVVKEAMEQTRELVKKESGREQLSIDDVIAVWKQWSEEDKKITPLKTVQGVLWKEGYESGEIKGHVYNDVAPTLEKWKEEGRQAGVFSSGSVAAQKLIFGYSEKGDLTPYFSCYFDTTTGGKRETVTYQDIAEKIGVPAGQILFLSDVKEELEAADAAGFQTLQLVRAGTEASWKNTVSSFEEINLS